MPSNGGTSGDGIEADALELNSGAIARVGVDEKKTHLIVRAAMAKQGG